MSGSREARPFVLAVLPGLIPSTLISIVKPLTALHKAGCLNAKITLESLAARRDLERADLIVFCRNTDPRHAFVLDRVQALGKPYVYDLDDNFFEVPLTTEEGQYHRQPERLEMLTRYLAGASRVRVYSESLRRRIQPVNAAIDLVSGSLDWSLIGPPAPETGDGRVRMVYVTSRLQDELAGIFLGDLRRLLERAPGQLELCFWGFQPPEMRGVPGVTFRYLDPDYDRFLRRLSASGFDIGLAPLVDDEFHRSKTNNKFREYGACRIAGVYSNVEVYSSCVTDGETGLLVENRPGAWLAAVERLVSDAALRRRIQAQAQDYVREHYSQTGAAEVWLRQIREVLGTPRPRPSSAVHLVDVPAPRGQVKRWLSFVTGAWQTALKLYNRARRIGLRPTLVGMYRYLYTLMLLVRIRRELSAPAAGADQRLS